MQIEKSEAEAVFNAFMGMYKGVAQWQKDCAAFARKHGYVEMPYGTRRHATADLWSTDLKLSGRQERQLANSQIQSSGADLLAVVRQEIFDRNMRERYEMRSIFFVYDEVTSSVPISKAEDYIAELAEVMRVQLPGFSTALDVDAKVGLTWGSQVEISSISREAIDEALEKLTTQSH